MKEELEKSLIALKAIEKIDLTADSSYWDIVNIVREQVFIPYVTLKIPIGTSLFRARLNEGCSFNLKSDISYNSNSSSIKIGRANYYHQSIFYASHKNETALFETSNILKEMDNVEEEIITVGTWLVNKEIEVIPIYHDIEFLKKHPEIEKKYFGFLKNNPLYTNPLIQEHFKFLSKEFAKKVTKIEEYKISCAFFNVMNEKKFRSSDVSGILYPSFEWEQNDINIALTPESVENCLSLVQVKEFNIKKYKDHNEILQTGTSDCIAYKINRVIPNI